MATLIEALPMILKVTYVNAIWVKAALLEEKGKVVTVRGLDSVNRKAARMALHILREDGKVKWLGLKRRWSVTEKPPEHVLDHCRKKGVPVNVDPFKTTLH